MQTLSHAERLATRRVPDTLFNLYEEIGIDLLGGFKREWTQLSNPLQTSPQFDIAGNQVPGLLHRLPP